MKISIGITTYNRPEYLHRMATSLYNCRHIDEHTIRIYDDASVEYDVQYIAGVFHSAGEIKRREKNLGADGNMHQMFVDFLATDDDVLFIADADLIFSPAALDTIVHLLPATDGILSLYNSVTHAVINEVEIAGTAMCTKQYFGAAGTALSRQVIDFIIKNVPVSDSYDWDWSVALGKQGTRLLCLKNSQVQHIGAVGQNSDGTFIDFGLNFYPGNEFNEKILVEFFQNALISKDKFIRSGVVYNLLRKKLRTLIRIIRRNIGGRHR
ncbi:Glycosyl transferase family 2 [Chitinophaga sp. YR573]|uniref:glycosyltransferase family 2 protein n=1 Tax=Chitinophaga sp. YR573 TaxID=1881040 RepID=UPI0008C0D417|nr:glycosyltransferase [Chitinophaga sp. YR573]SEW14464.1 Glycosyl transferase family 2 [Chitinophaga sp. YR573]